jgi:alanine racemase
MADLKKAGMDLPMLHVANSAATLRLNEVHMDCVRPGLILYGLYPRRVDEDEVDLRPALSMHSEVSFCKEVPAGTSVGYGHTFTTWRRSRIATLPLGYHDGYMRQYSNTGEMLIRGRRAPVVGRVCMDQTLADVTDIEGVRAGDPVVVYGTQKESKIGIEEMAGLVGRIPYELTCSVGGRGRRQYVLEGEVVGETPMRSVVPPSVVQDIFPSPEADEDTEREARRRGAA